MLNDTTKTVTRVAGGGGSGALGYTFNLAYYVALDASGNLYISDANDHIVLAVNRQATTQTILGVSIASGDIAVVAGVQGVNGYSGDSGPATSAHMSFPHGIAVDSNGNLYICDQGNTISGSSARIRKVSTSGTITTAAGTGTNGFTGDGGSPTSAELNRSLGVCLDASGNFYVTDTFNVVIRAVNNQATSQTLLNTSVASNTIKTVVGTAGNSGYSGDSGQATAAKLGNSPWFSGFDNLGSLYICDTGNFVVRS